MLGGLVYAYVHTSISYCELSEPSRDVCELRIDHRLQILILHAACHHHFSGCWQADRGRWGTSGWQSRGHPLQLTSRQLSDPMIEQASSGAGGQRAAGYAWLAGRGP